jgi:hypothetical protein
MAVLSDITPPALERYDPGKNRETIRSVLAILLIGLVMIEIIGLGALGSWAVINPTKDVGLDKVMGAIKEIAGVILSPSIALASAVMGFYYATKGD